MKKLILLLLTVIAMYICKAQTIDFNATRYYQASYFGEDSVGHLKYGIFFFSTNGNTFPSIEEAKATVIIGYKLAFSPIDDRMAIWITEFKNKMEWLKWNHSHNDANQYQ